MSIKINAAGVELIRKFEGCRLSAYPDPASPLSVELRKPSSLRVKDWHKLPGDPWTVGWGSTGVDPFNKDETGRQKQIGPFTKWTQEQCDQRNLEHIQEFAVKVSSLIRDKESINENQLSALVSLAYNIGVANLAKSMVMFHVNRKRWTEAADEFLKWNKAKGKVLDGLTRRREAERRLFLTPVEKA